MSVSEKRTELYVGLFVFVGLAVMAVLVLQFGRFGDRIRDSYPLHITFEDATGIFEGVDVRLGGVKIGSVSGRARPEPALKGVIIDLVVFSEFKIPNNATFRIRTSGLMGDSYVGVDVPEDASDEFYAPDSTIEGKKGGELQDLANTAEELSTKAMILLTELTETVKEIRVGMESLSSALAKFDNDVLGDENIDNVKVAISTLRATSEKISAAGDRLDPILDDAGSAVRNANGAFESVHEIMMQLEPVVDDFEKAAGGAASTVAKFNSGDGLMTALLNDPELRADFTALISNLRERGILRYKDSQPSTQATRNATSAPQPKPTPRQEAAPAPAPAPEPTEKKSWRPFNRRR